MNIRDEISTPYAISFATNSSCEKQSKAFERSASNAPKKIIKQCWALKPFLDSHWYFESILSKITESWLYKHLSKTLDKFDRYAK